MLKRSVCWALALTVCALAFAVAGASGGGDRQQAGEPPESKDSADAGSSTDSTKPAEKAKKNPLAGCTLCHVDVEDEYVDSVHFDEQVACTDCHGPSQEHLADENNEVKPDERFARQDTDRLCSDCHECDREIPPGWSDMPPDQRQVCTECHGAHGFPKAAVKKSPKSPSGE